MNLKVNDRIKDLHKKTIDHSYTKTQWWAKMKEKLSPAEVQELVGNAKMGLDYLLESEAVEALAITQFPWMTNQIEVVSDFGPTKGTMVFLDSWLTRIKANKTPSRPKDLIHLENICEIAENIDKLDDLF